MNTINRIRSRQAGHPSGLLGRLIGRLMVKDTATANDRALELLELKDESTILEIGFGQGRTTAVLIEQGHSVIGADVSATMVRQATARNRRACGDGRAELLLGDGVRMPFDDDAADAAFMAHTIYFMPDPQASIIDIARVLRPDGRLVIASRVGDDDMPAWMDTTIYHIPTIAEVHNFLDAAGLGRVEHHVGDASTHHTHWFVAER